MKRCKFSPLARADLREIHDYIAERDADAALDFVTRLQLACESLAAMPGQGRKRDDLAPGLRSFPVARYIIFYRRVTTGVEIARVVHGARDIEAIIADQ